MNKHQTGRFSTLILPPQGAPEANAYDAGIPVVVKFSHSWLPVDTARRIVEGDPAVVKKSPDGTDVYLLVPGHAPGFCSVLCIMQDELAPLQALLTQILEREPVNVRDMAGGSAAH